VFTVVKRTEAGRRRLAGAVASLAIGGALVLTTGLPAQAAPSVPQPRNNPGATGADPHAKLPNGKLPVGAKRATGQRPKVGSNGSVFSKAPQGTAKPRIVGGTLANSSQYPSVVGVQTFFFAPDENGDWYEWYTTCTGTVVSSTKVLTAAHCTIGFPFATTYVIAGRSNLEDSGGFVARVASTWTHQNYNYAHPEQAPVDDVSVLTLKDELPAAYPPVQLSGQGDQSPYADGTSALIVGYGVTSTDASDSGILRQATVPMKSNATCASDYGSSYDQSRMVCAGTPGVDTCFGDSGGPIFVNGVQVGITDWGHSECAVSYGVYERLSYYSDAVQTDLTRPSLVNLDWSGDGHSDLIGRNGDGDIVEYDGSGLANDGFGGFVSWGTLGVGWQGFTKLFRVTNWNGDGLPSIMARDSAGRLYQYTNDGRGGLSESGTQVGNGWNTFADIMVTSNWTGDGRPNVMGRKSNGDLYLYTSDGHGGWLNGGNGVRIGTGWNTFNTVLTPGTWAGDGHQALIGRKSNGDLLLYKSDGQGGWLNNGNGIKIGTGWNSFNIFLSPGDWNGDNMVDLIGITPAGAVSVYKSDGHGNWLDGGRGQAIGSGWNVFNTVF
jgi:hypothetical protein